MRDKYFYEVMFDDTSIDVSKEVGLVWSIANSLRGAYTSDKYKDVIIPMVIIRRFECALEATKDAVVAKHKQNPNLPAALLCQVSKYPFYNYSEYTLKRLLDDSDNIASNLKSYIEGFSANIQLILEKLRGGGHFDAAGAQVTGRTMNEVLVLLKSAINHYLDD